MEGTIQPFTWSGLFVNVSNQASIKEKSHSEILWELRFLTCACLKAWLVVGDDWTSLWQDLNCFIYEMLRCGYCHCVSYSSHAGMVHTDGSGAKESEQASNGGSRRCWVHLDMVLDTLHMKGKLLTESQNGNTNNSSTQGDPPGLN